MSVDPELCHVLSASHPQVEEIAEYIAACADQPSALRLIVSDLIAAIAEINESAEDVVERWLPPVRLPDLTERE